MTLPTTQPINGSDDDSDMFGPPRSSPPIGYHHHRSKVPMISPKLRQREERKRIIQLCAHKLERIKDSEANLRRSVCINNTYSRLNDEVRREKQNRYLANLPKPDTKPETAHDNIFSPYNSCNGGNNNNNNNQNNNNSALLTSTNNHHYLQNDEIDIYPNLTQNYHHNHHMPHLQSQPSSSHSNLNCNNTITTTSSSLLSTTSCALLSGGKPTTIPITSSSTNNNSSNSNNSSINNSNLSHHHHNNTNSILTSSSSSLSSSSISSCHSTNTSNNNSNNNNLSCQLSIINNNNDNHLTKKEKRNRSSSCMSNNSVDTDLEILDRELSAIDASMPLIDPEITQGAEHLEKAISSRKRLRSEDENDRLVREALSQFYLPTQRLISAIDDCPLDIKRSKSSSSLSSSSSSLMHNNNGICSNSTINMNHNHDLDLDLALDLNSTHKEFEVIMDALRLGTPSPTSSCGSDSCGQAAMMSESGGGVFHNLVVTSLET